MRLLLFISFFYSLLSHAEIVPEKSDWQIYTAYIQALGKEVSLLDPAKEIAIPDKSKARFKKLVGLQVKTISTDKLLQGLRADFYATSPEQRILNLNKDDIDNLWKSILESAGKKELAEKSRIDKMVHLILDGLERAPTTVELDSLVGSQILQVINQRLKQPANNPYLSREILKAVFKDEPTVKTMTQEQIAVFLKFLLSKEPFPEPGSAALPSMNAGDSFFRSVSELPPDEPGEVVKPPKPSK